MHSIARRLACLDEVHGVYRLPLLHDDLVLCNCHGPEEHCQADELVPLPGCKGLYPLEQAQHVLKLLQLQGSYLCSQLQLEAQRQRSSSSISNSSGSSDSMVKER